MEEFLKIFDRFGYTPTFLINGENQFKTKEGGIIFLMFLIFSIYYFISELIGFINSLNYVTTSRDVFFPSLSYNITAKDVYFGIGFVNETNAEYNISRFPYIKITMIKATIEGTIRTDTLVPLGSCDYRLFLNQNDLIDPDNPSFKKQIEKLKFYLCPDPSFNLFMNPLKFGGDEIFFELNFEFLNTNTSILDFARSDLNQVRPRLNFIYKDIKVDADDKFEPFNSFINSLNDEVDYDFSKKMEIFINPYEIWDDKEVFGSQNYAPLDSNSSQMNGTIFSLSMRSNLFGIYTNRSEPMSFQNKKPFLNFYKIKMILNSKMHYTERSYKKFDSFLAEVTSILSNMLIIFAIIMINYNSIQGKNSIIKTMYTYKSLNNMKEFNKDFKDFFFQEKGNLLTSIKRFQSIKLNEDESENKKCSLNKVSFATIIPNCNSDLDIILIPKQDLSSLKRYLNI